MDDRVEQLETGTALVRASGALTATNAAPLHEALLSLCRSRVLEAVRLDCRGLESLDSPAAAAACLGLRELERAGKRTELLLSPRQQLTFDLVSPLPVPVPRPITEPWLQRLGERVLWAARGLVQLAEFSAATASSAWSTLAGRGRLPMS